MTMRPFRDRPIRQKLTLSNVLISGIALILASFAFVVYEAVNFRQGMVDALTTYAGIIGYNCASALEFNDPESAAETLRALKAEEHITRAAVYRDDGQLFASYARPNTPPAPALD